MRLGLLLAISSLAVTAAAAEVRVSCRVLDDCYCHEADESVDPAELITLLMDFENTGDAPLVALRGEIRILAGAMPLFGTGSFGPLDSPLPPGSTYRKAISYQTTGGCGDLVDLELRDLRDGSEHVAAELVACDRLIGESECRACCLPVDVDAIGSVRAVKALGSSGDVLLSWAPDPAPSASHYNVWFVSGAANKAALPEARFAGSWPVVPGCFLTRLEACRHFGGLSAEQGALLFYQVRGSCDSIEADE